MAQSDLDTIAINDTKHDLCDLSPCKECADFEYRVMVDNYALENVYSDRTNRHMFHARSVAMRLAKNLAVAFKNTDRQVYVRVFCLYENPNEESCHYWFDDNGNFVKVG